MPDITEQLRAATRQASDNFDAACMDVFSTPEQRAFLHGARDAYVDALAIVTERTASEVRYDLDLD